jgi:hypothetical protein
MPIFLLIFLPWMLFYTPPPLLLLLGVILLPFLLILVLGGLYNTWYAWKKSPYIPSKPRNWG